MQFLSVPWTLLIHVPELYEGLLQCARQYSMFDDALCFLDDTDDDYTPIDLIKEVKKLRDENKTLHEDLESVVADAGVDIETIKRWYALGQAVEGMARGIGLYHEEDGKHEWSTAGGTGQYSWEEYKNTPLEALNAAKELMNEAK